MDFNATGWLGPVCIVLTGYGLVSLVLDVAAIIGGL